MNMLRLGDVAEKIGSGATPRGGDSVYQTEGIALIRSQNVYNDGFHRDGLAFISDGHADELSNVEVRAGDVLLNITGDSVARVCQVPDELLPARVNQHVAIIRPQPDKLDARYLRYHLTSPATQDYMLALAAAGATRNALTKGMIEDFEIPARPLPEQRAIAGVLGTLDDKIELNRCMNETLEAIAKALFQQMKIEGKPSKLGEVLSVIETGGRPKGGVGHITEGVPSVGAESIVGIGRFDFGKTKFVPREFFDSMTRGHVADGDVLLYKDGGRPGEFEPHVTMVGNGFPFDEFSINEHVYRLRTEPALPQSYLYFWLSSDGTMDEMRNRGTGVAIPGLNSTQVRELSILLPPADVLSEFDQKVSPLIRRIFANCNESRTLAALRDALLPKLLSGAVRVRPERMKDEG